MECVTSDNWLYLDICILHSLHYNVQIKIFINTYILCLPIIIHLDADIFRYIWTSIQFHLGISRNRQLTFEEHVKNKELDNGHQMDSNL